MCIKKIKDPSVYSLLEPTTNIKQNSSKYLLEITSRRQSKTTLIIAFYCTERSTQNPSHAEIRYPRKVFKCIKCYKNFVQGLPGNHDKPSPQKSTHQSTITYADCMRQFTQAVPQVWIMLIK